MIEARSINQNNLAVVMLDKKVLHSRRAGIQIVANFGQSFAGCRVDELPLALNTVFPQI
jgi:hypothetical protein